MRSRSIPGVSAVLVATGRGEVRALGHGGGELRHVCQAAHDRLTAAIPSLDLPAATAYCQAWRSSFTGV